LIIAKLITGACIHPVKDDCTRYETNYECYVHIMCKGFVCSLMFNNEHDLVYFWLNYVAGRGLCIACNTLRMLVTLIKPTDNEKWRVVKYLKTEVTYYIYNTPPFFPFRFDIPLNLKSSSFYFAKTLIAIFTLLIIIHSCHDLENNDILMSVIHEVTIVKLTIITCVCCGTMSHWPPT
jgi:hypothetical protein